MQEADAGAQRDQAQDQSGSARDAREPGEGSGAGTSDEVKSGTDLMSWESCRSREGRHSTALTE